MWSGDHVPRRRHVTNDTSPDRAKASTGAIMSQKTPERTALTIGIGHPLVTRAPVTMEAKVTMGLVRPRKILMINTPSCSSLLDADAQANLPSSSAQLKRRRPEERSDNSWRGSLTQGAIVDKTLQPRTESGQGLFSQQDPVLGGVSLTPAIQSNPTVPLCPWPVTRSYIVQAVPAGGRQRRDGSLGGLKALISGGPFDRSTDDPDDRSSVSAATTPPLASFSLSMLL